MEIERDMIWAGCLIEDEESQMRITFSRSRRFVEHKNVLVRYAYSGSQEGMLSYS